MAGIGKDLSKLVPLSSPPNDVILRSPSWDSYLFGKAD
jgi:hypothetical protein